MSDQLDVRPPYLGVNGGSIPQKMKTVKRQPTCIQFGCRFTWSRKKDLNPHPAVYNTAALPLSYFGISEWEASEGVRALAHVPEGALAHVF